MQQTPESVVTVGASQSAAVAVRTLRRRGFDGRITVVGEESHTPYQRPPLSKEYLAGEESREGLNILSEQWCAQNAVELRLGAKARRIDTANGALELSDGSRVLGDRFLLATGARARTLPNLPEDDRIVLLRTVEDADRLRSLLRPGSRVLIVGAGFIGSEVASTARELGVTPIVLEAAETPLERVLGRQMGEFCADLQRDAGVELHTGETFDTVHTSPQAITLTTRSGLQLSGDVLVLAVGAAPRTEVAHASGLAVSAGILVDEHCRTSAPNIYAAGDVANQRHPLYERWVRAEHFDNASKQAMVVAKNIVGRDAVQAEPHWFWSDQFGVNLQHCGRATEYDELVIRGSLEERDFTAFYLADGVLKAAFAAERGDEVFTARELIARRAVVDPAMLRDEATDLTEVADRAHAESSASGGN